MWILNPWFWADFMLAIIYTYAHTIAIRLKVIFFYCLAVARLASSIIYEWFYLFVWGLSYSCNSTIKGIGYA